MLPGSGKKRKGKRLSFASPPPSSSAKLTIKGSIDAIELEISRSKKHAAFIANRLETVTKSIAQTEEQLGSINTLVASSETEVLKMISASLKHKETLFKLYNSLGSLSSSASGTLINSNLAPTAMGAFSTKTSALVPSINPKKSTLKQQSYNPDAILLMAMWRLVTKGSLFYHSDIASSCQAAYIQNIDFLASLASSAESKSLRELFAAKRSMIASSHSTEPLPTTNHIAASGALTRPNSGHVSMDALPSNKDVKAGVKRSASSANDTLCPYELLGSCSDPQCSYRHLSSYKIAPPSVSANSSTNNRKKGNQSSKAEPVPHHRAAAADSVVPLSTALPQLLASYRLLTQNTGDSDQLWVIDLVTALSEDSTLVVQASGRPSHCYNTARALLRSLLAPLLVDPFNHAVAVDKAIKVLGDALQNQRRQYIDQPAASNTNGVIEIWQLFLQLSTMLKSGNSGRRTTAVLDAVMVPSLLRAAPHVNDVMRHVLVHFASPDVVASTDPVLATLLKLERQCTEYGNFEAVVNSLLQQPLFDKSLAYQLNRYVHNDRKALGATLPALNLPGPKALASIPADIKLASVLSAVLLGEFCGADLYLRQSEWLVYPTLMTSSVCGGGDAMAACWVRLMRRCEPLKACMKDSLRALLKMVAIGNGSTASLSLLMRSLVLCHRYCDGLIDEFLADPSLDLVHQRIVESLAWHCPHTSSCADVTRLYVAITSQLITKTMISNAGSGAGGNRVPPALVSLNQTFTMTQELESILGNIANADAQIDSIKFTYEFDSRFPGANKTAFLGLQNRLVQYAVSQGQSQVYSKGPLAGQSNVAYDAYSKQVALGILDWLILGSQCRFFSFENYKVLLDELRSKLLGLSSLSKQSFAATASRDGGGSNKKKSPADSVQTFDPTVSMNSGSETDFATATTANVSVMARILKVATLFTLYSVSSTHHEDDRNTASKNVMMMLLQVLSIVHTHQPSSLVAEKNTANGSSLFRSTSPLLSSEIHWYHELFFDVLTVGMHQFKVIDVNTHLSAVWKEYLLELGCPELLLRWAERHVIRSMKSNTVTSSLDTMPLLNRYHLVMQFLPEQLFSCHYLSQCSDGALAIVKKILAQVAGPQGDNLQACLEFAVFKSHYTQMFFYPRDRCRSWLSHMLPAFIHPQRSQLALSSKSVQDLSLTAISGSLPYLHESWTVDEGLAALAATVDESHLHTLFSSYLKQLSLGDVHTPVTLNLTGVLSFSEATTATSVAIAPAMTLTSLLPFKNNLVDLTLSQCNLLVVPPVVLLMAKLKRLDLSKNVLKALPGDMAACFSVLEVLNLSWNMLDEYPEVIKNIATLKELYLTGNMCQAPK